ncbi:hypothetical protein ACEZCY_02515 [Streptacidiphilus sp. N1-12]|uniref:Uncharacterized protein n=2 Tax=Streptacidiphilus alkalitolerans TaxID=3342712 RepID=A0ABV6V362_9ACTN
MLTVMVLALIFGFCLLIAAATSLLLHVGELHEGRLVERTPLTPLGALHGGRRRIAAVGETAYGPAGPLTAPVSGEECAWFAIRLVRTPTRRQTEDTPGEDLLLDLAAPMPPALVDPSGHVLIDPRLLTGPPNLHDPVATELTLRVLGPSSVDTAPPIVPRRLIETARSHERLELWETRLAAGRQVYALGSAGHGHRQGSIVLLPTRHGGFTVLTTDDRTAVRERRRLQAANSRSLARSLGMAGAVVTLLSGALVLWFAQSP